ncbi:MAG: sigma-54 dependent transcriptional regulator [Elusimicrobiota bacterium]|nr:sigma-54 dependent transcriptional regulator [Elusimicrobiota bacterium]
MTRKLKILIVEDDPLSRKLVEGELRGHAVDFAVDLASGRKKIAAGGHDICFIDLKLGDKDAASGLELVPLAAKSGAYCVVMSAHDSDAVVQKAYELGCDDFYAKGNEEENVSSVVARFLRKRPEEGEDRLFKDLFVTEDAATKVAVGEALKYAASDVPIMILGPSGTGKTSLAEVIHGRSGRRGAFVAMNCADYATEDMLEIELFGYRKGAFTGAGDGRKGKLLLADGGTLFLDEIGSMSPAMQSRLLKAIEERSFYPVGSDSLVKSRFRVISATLENPQSLVKRGRMRFDLLQRVQGLTIELKPLARRKDDVLPLIAFFTRKGRRLAFADDAKELLLRHEWPGNVRELKKFVELAVAGEPGRVTADAARRVLALTRAAESSDGFLTETQYREALSEGLSAAVARFEGEAIRRSLAENAGRKDKAAQDLRIAAKVIDAHLKRSDGPGGRTDGD